MQKNSLRSNQFFQFSLAKHEPVPNICRLQFSTHAICRKTSKETFRRREQGLRMIMTYSFRSRDVILVFCLGIKTYQKLKEYRTLLKSLKQLRFLSRSIVSGKTN